MKKRILAFLMATLMIVTLFAGCSKEEPVEDTKEPEVGVENETVGEEQETEENPFEGVTVTMGIYSNYEITADAWIFQQIKEHTGVTVEPICYTADVYGEKLGGWIANNDLPDIFQSYNLQLSEINKYGDQGAFVNLNDPAVLDQVPSYKALYVDNADNNEKYQKFFSESGGYYCMPYYGVARDVNHCLMYREDIFAELGIEPWTDSESFLEALRALKAAYPDSYPLTGADWNNTVSRLANSFNTNSMYNAYDWEAGQWYLGAASEEYLELLEVLQTAYEEGLMDPDIFTNSTDAIDARILNDQSFVFYSWIGRMAAQNPVGQETKESFNVVPGNAIGTGRFLELSKFSGEGGTIVTNGKNQAAALAVMDFLFSEEGSYIFTVGVEGDNYVVEDGKIVYPELESATIQTLEEKYGMWLAGYYNCLTKDSVYFTFTENEQMAQDLGNAAGYYKTVPPVSVAADDQTAYTDLTAALQADVQEFTTNYVINGYGDAEWTAWVQSLNADYSELVNILNK